MTIKNFHQEAEFGAKLANVLAHSHPIDSPEFLNGREKELQTIRQALYAPGRHIFIHGDRGVGKSSLAKTAAYLHQSAEASPIFVSGSSSDTFSTIIASIAFQALGRSRTSTEKASKSAEFSWRGLKLGGSLETSPTDIASAIKTIGDAVDILQEVTRTHSENPVIVIDEFDTITEDDERNKFAELLKQLGDRQINIKLIFTGIGSSLEELLGAHLSAHRQLEQVEVFRLPIEARWAIVTRAAEEFDLTVDRDVVIRIGMISDGFPSYVHLMTEKMLWAAYNSHDVVTELEWPQFHEGLHAAIESVSIEMKGPYEKAMMAADSALEDVLWSTADGEELVRSADSMYESYKVVRTKRENQPHLNRSEYGKELQKLKKPGYGAILISWSGRPGFSRYRETLMRGYVRMQAEANGVTLSGGRQGPSQKMKVSNRKTGYYSSKPPKGVLWEDSDQETGPS